MTQEEVDGLLSGEGLGMARAAELNGYPGPRHVLELQGELALDAATVEATQQLFDETQAAAVPVGAELVMLEKELGELFASGEIDDTSLQERVEEIAVKTGELRTIHLRAHLRMMELMSDG